LLLTPHVSFLWNAITKGLKKDIPLPFVLSMAKAPQAGRVLTEKGEKGYKICDFMSRQ
jgi:hypothetical protein